MRYQNVDLHNVWEIVEEEDQPGFKTLRIPRAVWETVNNNAQRFAWNSAGCEIRGMLKSDGEATVVLKALDDNVTPPVVSVYHGCFRSQTIALTDEPTTITLKPPANALLIDKLTKSKDLPFNERLVRVRLPNIHSVRVLSIEGDLSYPEPTAMPSKTLLCYGSSITQGAWAIAPESTYAAQCARLLGCDLINLGFGGGAHLERSVAEHVASRSDWDFATLEMGINVRSWPLEKFRSAVETFVDIIVTARPDAHVFCIDLYTNDDDFRDEPTLALGFREAVKEIAARYDSGYVHYVDGRTILTNPTGLQTDLVHPTDDGMAEMGANLAKVIAGTCEI